jgi:RHS repeat-associated protein
MRYTPWGEVRSHWTASASISLADYTFTGQYSYMDDPSTTGVTEGFGLMFYNARMYDPALGRFTSADTIVPAGVQGWDRYAYGLNNPSRYTDPSGHRPVEGCGDDGSRACYASPLEKILNNQRNAEFQAETNRNKCKGGNQSYCGESVLNIIAFGLTSLGGAAAAETVILGGGVEASLWSLQQIAWRAGWALEEATTAGLAKTFQLLASNPKTEKPFMDFMTKMGTINPGSKNILIGNFPEYRDLATSKGYTYFQLPSMIYNALDRSNLGQRVNSNVIYDSISAGKNFYLIAPRPAGWGLLEELDILLSFHVPVSPLP